MQWVVCRQCGQETSGQTWPWRSTRRSSRCQQILESLSSSRIFFRTFHKNNFQCEKLENILFGSRQHEPREYIQWNIYIYILGTVISYLLISDTFIWSKSLISDSVTNRYKQLFFPKTIFTWNFLELTHYTSTTRSDTCLRDHCDRQWIRISQYPAYESESTQGQQSTPAVATWVLSSTAHPGHLCRRFTPGMSQSTMVSPWAEETLYL